MTEQSSGTVVAMPATRGAARLRQPRRPYRLYRKVTADRQDAAVAEHRALEIARLDALQAALRPKAIDGDVQAGRHGAEDR